MLSSSSFKLNIVVSQRVDVIPCRDETRDALDHNLISWLHYLDLNPFPVPNSIVDLASWLSVINPNAILLSGGNNIGEFSMRDSIEFQLLDFASRNGLPVLGICRGMQLMAFRDGAKLVPTTGHTSTVHDLTFPSLKYPFPNSVNSYHDFSIDHCPSSYYVLANSTDGVIEAIHHNTLPWEAWMWHPERPSASSKLLATRARCLFTNHLL